MQTDNEGTQQADPDFLAMSDDDVMAMQPPAKETPAAEPVVAETPAESVEAVAEVVDPAAAVEPVAVAGEVADPLAAADDETVTKPAKKADATTKTVAADASDPAAKVEETKPAAAAAVDYEASYKKIMAPFKANGRDIELQSPDEAVKLMQMGANYTKKMQGLQPTLRLVKMLENNQLLDEGQLSYLIDLHQKKPEAIQRLLADSKFDPLSADVEKAAGYVPGDHRVSENEIQFQTALEDVESTPTGQALIAEVAKQWDADSKQALFNEPRLLAEINNQKANGLYGLISTEIERRRVLGDLQGVPFLAAYNAVGNDLKARGLLVPQGAVQPAVEQAAPVTRVVAPTAAVVNSDRARAAMPAKGAAATVKTDVNFLEQSDEDFVKSMNGRL